MTLTRSEVSSLAFGAHQTPLPLCARCGKQVEHGEAFASPTMNRYILRVHCHGETEEVWVDMKELVGMTGNLVLRPAFLKELPHDPTGTEKTLR